MNTVKDSIKIIKASVTDAHSICKIGRLSFKDAFMHLFEKPGELTEYLDHTYAVSKVFNSLENPNNIFFLAFVDDIAVGFSKMKKASLQKNLEAERQSELQKIYVLKQYHGTGIGQGLLDAVIKSSIEIHSDLVWLDVHVSNAKAMKFYEKNKFHITGDHSYTIGSQIFYYKVMALGLLTQ